MAKHDAGMAIALRAERDRISDAVGRLDKLTGRTGKFDVDSLSEAIDEVERMYTEALTAIRDGRTSYHLATRRLDDTEQAVIRRDGVIRDLQVALASVRGNPDARINPPRRDCEQWGMGCNLPRGHKGKHSVELSSPAHYLDEPCIDGTMDHDASRSHFGSRICAKCDATAREESPLPNDKAGA